MNISPTSSAALWRGERGCGGGRCGGDDGAVARVPWEGGRVRWKSEIGIIFPFPLNFGTKNNRKNGGK